MIPHRSALLGLLAALFTTPLLSAGATDIASYRLQFHATWSSETHPISFPSLAHFSSLVGGTHNADVAFWSPGGIASPGIESMAEAGATATLLSEVQSAIDAGSAQERILDTGVFSPGGPITVFFDLNQSHSRATIVSMIAPSPDWFVGTHGLELFVDGAWVDEVVVDLYPYDAGTDSGANYTSINQDTNPQDPIMQITGFPFTSGADPVPPLGTFTFTRITCVGDIDADGDTGFSDILAVLSAWGCAGDCAEDLTGNGDVGFDDLLTVLGAFGPCP